MSKPIPLAPPWAGLQPMGDTHKWGSADDSPSVERRPTLAQQVDARLGRNPLEPTPETLEEAANSGFTVEEWLRRHGWIR